MQKNSKIVFVVAVLALSLQAPHAWSSNSAPDPAEASKATYDDAITTNEVESNKTAPVPAPAEPAVTESALIKPAETEPAREAQAPAKRRLTPSDLQKMIQAEVSELTEIEGLPKDEAHKRIAGKREEIQKAEVYLNILRHDFIQLNVKKNDATLKAVTLTLPAAGLGFLSYYLSKGKTSYAKAADERLRAVLQDKQKLEFRPAVLARLDQFLKARGSELSFAGGNSLYLRHGGGDLAGHFTKLEDGIKMTRELLLQIELKDKALAAEIASHFDLPKSGDVELRLATAEQKAEARKNIDRTIGRNFWVRNSFTLALAVSLGAQLGVMAYTGQQVVQLVYDSSELRVLQEAVETEIQLIKMKKIMLAQVEQKVEAR